jgi:predicted GNAT family acetyltransferase/2'-5' RNA ligase
MPEPPLILSAVLDAPVQRRLDALRRAHFPPERNHLDAHVTLFHHLPGAEVDAVARAVATVARQRPAPPVEVTGVRLLGRGVAVALASPELAAVRAGLAGDWSTWLTAQDRSKRDLHVTVQNKVTPNAARALHAELSVGFVPERTQAVALALWRYRGGPWEAVARYAFAGEGTDMADSPTVRDVPERSRFEVDVDGAAVGFVAYRAKPGLLVFTHTEIYDAVEGRGLGSTLVRGALDTARNRGLSVRPDCPFVRAFLTRHPEYLDLVPADLR